MGLFNSIYVMGVVRSQSCSIPNWECRDSMRGSYFHDLQLTIFWSQNLYNSPQLIVNPNRTILKKSEDNFSLGNIKIIISLLSPGRFSAFTDPKF